MFLERRDKNDNHYVRLQNRTLELLQQVSGKVWTDFNAHDPGVTIADAFNYALYELHYLFQFPFESFLQVTRDDAACYSRQGLFEAAGLFSDSIVTASDYEQLIKEQVEEVVACRVSLDDRGRYRIEVRLSGEYPEQTVTRIEHVYHSHRNLCENLGGVFIVDTLPHAPQSANVIRPETSRTEQQDTFYPRIPVGYYSIQNHFPECYGLGERGISSSSTNEYRAKIRQLKAYLLLFDYSLATVEAQVRNIKTLLTLSGEVAEEQIPSVHIKDIDRLIDTERQDEAEAVPPEFWHKQKSCFLDVLDTIYGEDTRIFFSHSERLNEQNHQRAHWIAAFPELNRNRFRSFNILDEKDRKPAVKRILELILGYESADEIPVANFFARYRLQLLDDRTFFTRHKQKVSVDITEDADADQPEEVPVREVQHDESRYKELYTRINLLWYNILYESFLAYGSDIGHYRIVNQWEKGFLLVFKIPGEAEWLMIGQFYEKELLIETANLFCRFIAHLYLNIRNFYLLEHTLLTGSDEEGTDCAGLSVVFPLWAESFSWEEYRERIRERLPAHIRVEFVGVSVSGMQLFERNYYGWRKALADKDRSQIEYFSDLLKDMLNHFKN